MLSFGTRVGRDMRDVCRDSIPGGDHGHTLNSALAHEALLDEVLASRQGVCDRLLAIEKAKLSDALLELAHVVNTYQSCVNKVKRELERIREETIAATSAEPSEVIQGGSNLGYCRLRLLRGDCTCNKAMT